MTPRCPSAHRPARFSARAGRRRGALPGSLALAVALALLMGCTFVHRNVVSTDETSGREVAVLSGTEPPDPPPVAEIAQLSPLEAEASLRRLIVRPSTWASFMRGDPEPFLSPEQLTWARGAVAPEIPRLKPDQRLQLRFRDRFHHYETEVEIYPQGRTLVYRFTKLADQPEELRRDNPAVTAPHYVEFAAQPGQNVDIDGGVVTLQDAVVGRAEREAPLAANVALLDEAVKAGRLSAEDAAPARTLLEANPRVGSDALKLYLEKLATVIKAENQGIFSAEEAKARKEKLLDELRETAPGAPKQ